MIRVGIVGLPNVGKSTVFNALCGAQARVSNYAFCTIEPNRAVVPVPDPVRGEEVKAYIQLQDGVSRSDVPPERILAHCEAGLARFKIPRYIAYRDSFSYTASDRVEKKKLTDDVADLRADSYDRVDKVWR